MNQHVVKNLTVFVTEPPRGGKGGKGGDFTKLEFQSQTNYVSSYLQYCQQYTLWLKSAEVIRNYLCSFCREVKNGN